MCPKSSCRCGKKQWISLLMVKQKWEFTCKKNSQWRTWPERSRSGGAATFVVALIDCVSTVSLFCSLLSRFLPLVYFSINVIFAVTFVHALDWFFFHAHYAFFCRLFIFYRYNFAVAFTHVLNLFLLMPIMLSAVGLFLPLVYFSIDVISIAFTHVLNHFFCSCPPCFLPLVYFSIDIIFAVATQCGLFLCFKHLLTQSDM